jgi:hypothetical protein
MDAFRIMFTVFVLRLVLPVGLLLVIGEQIRKRSQPNDYGR